VTADDGSFDSGPLAPRASFGRTFPSAGLFTVHCAIHPQMVGAVTVTPAPAPGGGPANRVPGTGVGTATPRSPLPLALLTLVTAAALGRCAIRLRCR
jgi:hypothetical protein